MPPTVEIMPAPLGLASPAVVASQWRACRVLPVPCAAAASAGISTAFAALECGSGGPKSHSPNGCRGSEPAEVSVLPTTVHKCGGAAPQKRTVANGRNGDKRQQPAGHICASARRHVAAQRCMDRLPELLAVLPRERRKAMIQGLPEEVRRMLLLHMQTAAGVKRAAGFAPRHSQECNEAIRCRQLRKRGRGARSLVHKAGVTTFGGSYTSSTRYVARMTIDGIAIGSQAVPSRREAECLRECLASVAKAKTALQAPLERSAGDPAGSWLIGIFTGILGGHGPQAMESGLAQISTVRWSFRVLLDARKWVGSTWSSPVFRSISEAIELRNRARAAQDAGWGAFREIILDSAASPERGQDVVGAESRARQPGCTVTDRSVQPGAAVRDRPAEQEVQGQSSTSAPWGVCHPRRRQATQLDVKYQSWQRARRSREADATERIIVRLASRLKGCQWVPQQRKQPPDKKLKTTL